MSAVVTTVTEKLILTILRGTHIHGGRQKRHGSHGQKAALGIEQVGTMSCSPYKELT